jgi:hypothetical protein
MERWPSQSPYTTVHWRSTPTCTLSYSSPTDADVAVVDDDRMPPVIGVKLPIPVHV